MADFMLKSHFNPNIIDRWLDAIAKNYSKQSFQNCRAKGKQAQHQMTCRHFYFAPFLPTLLSCAKHFYQCAIYAMRHTWIGLRFVRNASECFKWMCKKHHMPTAKCVNVSTANHIDTKTTFILIAYKRMNSSENLISSNANYQT